MTTVTSTGQRVTEARVVTCSKEWAYAIEVTLVATNSDQHDPEEVRET